MKFLKIILLVFIVTVFCSCDCLQHVQGVVIDSETRLPIDKVIIREKDTMNIMKGIRHTDSLGNFEYRAMRVAIFGCPKISLTFEKEGYIKTSQKYKSCCTDNVVIVLEKQVK